MERGNFFVSNQSSVVVAFVKLTRFVNTYIIFFLPVLSLGMCVGRAGGR